MSITFAVRDFHMLDQDELRALNEEEELIAKTEQRMTRGPGAGTRITGHLKDGQFIAKDIEWQEEYRAEDGSLVMTSEPIPVGSSIDTLTVNTDELFRKR